MPHSSDPSSFRHDARGVDGEPSLCLGSIAVELSAEQLEALARRLGELVATPRAAEMPASPYLSVPEAAAYLRATRQRVYDLLSAGVLHRYKDGGRTLVSRAELEAYVRVHR